MKGGQQTMTYNKPEVPALGAAAVELQTAQKPMTSGSDPSPNNFAFVPAYDLDE